MSEAAPRLDRRGRRGLILGAVVMALLIWTLFAAAGRWDWTRGWAAVAVFVAGHLANRLLLWRINPELLNRRGTRSREMRPWDRRIMAAVLLLPFAIAAVAGHDAGRQLSSMPWWLFGIGAGLFIVGVAFGVWAMAVNAHFEKTVRIQHEHQHRVIDGGPYRFIRHPGYAGGIAVYLAAPLLLGSWWALVPATLFILAIGYRAAREDRTLHEELGGYRDYAARVRARLIPGLW